MTKNLILYYRPACSLCEAMHRELLASPWQDQLQVMLVDIDSDLALRARFDHKVPVLVGEHDEEICHYFLDHEALRNYFATH